MNISLQHNFVKRVLVGSIFVAVLLASIALGPLVFASLLALGALFAVYEFYRMSKKTQLISLTVPGLIATALLPFSALYGEMYPIALCLMLLGVLFIVYLFTPELSLSDVALSLLGPLYVGLMLAPLVFIRSAEPSFSCALLTMVIFISVWVNDSFAYLAGTLFGKHKMVPSISPKKSWEGFVAGLFGSILIWLCALWIPNLPALNVGLCLALGLSCGVAGFLGDLIESRIKREAQVKDSGTFLPGHGGMLDRIDSLILVSLIAFLILRFSGVIA